MLLIVFSRCAAQPQQLSCFKTQLDSLKKTSLYNEVKSQALDSLNSWVNSKIMAIGIPPLRKDVEWKLDDVIFFNKEGTKAMVLILEKETASNSKLDAVKYILGNLEKNNWQFYFKTLPVLYIPRPEGTALDFTSISAFGVKKVLKDYFNGSTCNINDHFLEEWDINMLKGMHKEFLNE